MKVRIAGFANDSIVDGEGLRFTIFVQGCLHNCKGCHNPQTHSFEGGTLMDTEDIEQMIVKQVPMLDGITLSGGEPFLQQSACLELAKFAHKLDLNVWCYTGYEYNAVENTDLIKEIDVLVDGKYVESLRSLDLLYRGSSNQKIIFLKNGKKVRILE